MILIYKYLSFSLGHGTMVCSGPWSAFAVAAFSGPGISATFFKISWIFLRVSSWSIAATAKAKCQVTVMGNVTDVNNYQLIVALE